MNQEERDLGANCAGILDAVSSGARGFVHPCLRHRLGELEPWSVPASFERRHLGHGHHGLADGHQRHLNRLPLVPGGTSRERG